VCCLCVGSETSHGAASNMMPQALERIVFALGGGDISALQRSYRNSFVISADMAHAVHPNYPYEFLVIFIYFYLVFLLLLFISN